MNTKDDPLPIEANQHILNYRIVDKIGEGGMGVVWRAVDTTLDREVAIKFLLEPVASHADRMARFEREAKLLASLNHPNIAAIHGQYELNGLHFLVMELVPGEDLSARMDRGPIAVPEAVDIARQVAEALETAHEAGIIHRDLKPANIKIAPDGTVKVLDFGLAKALDPAASGVDGDPMLSPTLTNAATAVGTLLGTAAYMSPEQTRGRPVDRRADIWAFGVVLFEMLTAQPLFAGQTVSDILAAVLTQQPDWAKLDPRTPPALRTLLRRCLDRDPRRRLRDIGEARVMLESVEEPAEAMIAEKPARSRVVSVAAAVTAAAVAAGLIWIFNPRPEAPLRRLSLAPPVAIEGPRQVPSIAPDGRSMAYLADGKLWVQGLDQLTARPVTGGDQASVVGWSPDGRSLVFTVGNRIFHAEVGGDPALVGESPSPISSTGGGVCWTGNDSIVFTTGDNDLFEVPVTGGTPRPILKPDPRIETDFHEPSALPGGRGILYVVHRKAEGLDTMEVLADGRRKVIFQEDGASISHPRYSPTGHLLFERSDLTLGIWAVPFSLSTLEITGEPFLVASLGSFPTVSHDGSLLYSNRASGGSHQLVLVAADGQVIETYSAELQHVDNVALSHDGERLAACIIEGKDQALWVYDLVRESRKRVAFGVGCSGRRTSVAWTADDTGVVFGNTENSGVFEIQVDGGGETQLTEGLQPTLSGDGRLLAFMRDSVDTQTDIWWLRLDGSSAPEPLVATPAREDLPKLSPDGELLAYVSNETGRAEVYLRALNGTGATWQVSDGGGEYPRWSPSGDRLFFTHNEDELVVVSIARDPRLDIGPSQTLYSSTQLLFGHTHGYDASVRDNEVITVLLDDSSVSGHGDLTLVTAWPGP